MDSIVLRDRNGKEINYHGIDYLNVKTPDGETQGYAAYDPETLVPENLVSGVKVGDVEGALEVPQAVETTIDPDFSAGDMEVVPEDGKVFSKAIIQKPETLVPENIAEGVNVAGIVGALSAGGSGGGKSLCIFNRTVYARRAGYSGSIKVRTAEAIITLPPDSIVHDVRSYTASELYASSTNISTNINTTLSRIDGVTPTITESSDGTTIRLACQRQNSGIVIVAALLSCDYTVPGIYREMSENEIVGLYADETVTKLPKYMNLTDNAVEVNLANSKITEIPSCAFYQCNISVISLPATVQSISESGIYNIDTAPCVVDMTKHTSVPTLVATKAFNTAGGLEIRVPSALYEEWIAATNWASLKSYIVAV